nr:hypothetical protein [Tanacetum cinerariifolium]
MMNVVGINRMVDRRSKEDYVHQISMSIYVTKFPKQFSFRDHWKKCQEYGRVIDVYIPNRRNKSGDRFGFVRFIHIKDVDRLVKNLCTLLMGRLRLHANVARFQRPPLNKAQRVKRANAGQKSFGVSSNSKVFSVSQCSYAGAVKTNRSGMYENLNEHPGELHDGEHKQVAEIDSKPSLVIDESCMLEYDYSLALKGKVADFGLLTNLKTVVTKEGFESVNLKYLGGFWVLIEFCTKELLEKFKSHVRVGSWFSSLDKRICIKTKMEQNIFETSKIIIKGKVFWIRAKKVSGWILDFLDEDEEDEEDDESDEDFEMVPDTIFSPIKEEPKHDNKSKFEEGEIQSEDPFHIYDVLVKKPKKDDVVEVQENTKKSNIQDNFTKDNNVRGVTHSKEEDKESFCSVQFRRSVGLAQKAKKDWVKELYNKNKMKFLSLQEIKMELNNTLCVKKCWGNYSFEFVYGPSVGNAGGILCAWDPSMFHKHNAMISDYFVAIQGEWIENAKKYHVISVYAPQEASEKRMLWSYLNHMIDSGLVEVPLEGCSFTWCHKSCSKISKLDRFLISKGIMGFCPNITSITLDRYLSDHRPIILREMVSIRVVLGLAASLDLEVEQMDVKTAFLHGDLDKKIYREQPEGFQVKGKEDYVCRLQKSFKSVTSVEMAFLNEEEMCRVNEEEMCRAPTILTTGKKWHSLIKMKRVVLMKQKCVVRPQYLLLLNSPDLFDKYSAGIS